MAFFRQTANIDACCRPSTIVDMKRYANTCGWYGVRQGSRKLSLEHARRWTSPTSPKLNGGSVIWMSCSIWTGAVLASYSRKSPSWTWWKLGLSSPRLHLWATLPQPYGVRERGCP